MKSEHRHELKENELGKLTIQAQSFLKTYSNQILLGLTGALVVIVGLVVWVQMSNASASVGWTLYEKADSPEDYANIAEKLPKTVVGQWSRLNESENYLSTGLQNAFKDRKGALSDLKKAQDGFEAVLNGKPLPEELHERALFGLARTLEIMSGEDTSKAIEVYSKLLQAYPNSAYQQLAKHRVESLKSGGTQEFYAWFQKQNPELEDRPKPKDGLPADHPPIDLKLPGLPTEKKPDADHPVDLPTKPPEGVKPKGEEKGEGDESKKDEKPADKTDPKPEEKKPEEKKADEKKIDEKKVDPESAKDEKKPE